MPKVNFFSKDKRIYQSTLVIFLLISILMGVLCFQYYKRVQSTVSAEASEYMREISKQISTNVSKTINSNFSVLGTIGTVLENSKVTSYAQFQPVVREQQFFWNYQKIILIDENGIAHDENGKTVVLSSDVYLQDAVAGRKNSMSTSQVVNGQECIVFAIPLDDIVIEGTKMLALAATYELTTFDKILSMSAFDGKGYAHIVRNDGTVVIRSSSENALQTGYNILNSISDAKIKGTTTIDDIKFDILNGESGQTEFTMNGIREYMTYMPLETQEWNLLTFVPASVVNKKSTLLLKITLLLCGFVTIAFSLLIAFLSLSFYRHKSKLEQIAYIDPITRGNTIQRFYELAQTTLHSSSKNQYALIYTNIEKFKVLNEQFGKNACDEVLRGIAHGIASDLNSNESIGRLFADNFCILVEYTDEASMVTRFDTWHKACSKHIEGNDFTWLPLILEFGIFIIDNKSMPFPHMIDRAKLALSETTAKLHGKLRYAIYDEKIRRQLFREKHLEDRMEDALKNREFQIYLQPKYHTQSGEIRGAEALIRWVTAAEGMIYPDDFIPLFEKNGFIIQIDLWVFEEVCKTIRGWLDAGCEPVKVSINCSRMHLKTANFLERYCSIADQYKIPPHLVEIELTENTVFEDVEHLSKIINEIHHAGFGCSMDDFGSGYSSLNLIQDIPVDTLKIDKIFFRSNTKNLQRTESVIGSILSMSKALSMETVAEGVEEQQQVDMLKRLNCDYIQGYFFSKPIPIVEFEQLTFHKVINETIHNGKENRNKCLKK